MSDNSPTSDRWRWVVPIVVAIIAAISTVIAALAPSLFSGDEDAAPPNADPTTSTSADPPGGSRPTTIKRVTPTTTPLTTAVIAYSGDDIITSSDPTIDLDSPSDGAEGDNIGDLVHTTSALTTSSGSRIAPLDRAQIPSPEVCRSALDERGLDTITVAQLEDGLSLCIRTTADRIGAIRMTLVLKKNQSSEIRSVSFSYMIWNAAPE